MILPVDIHDRGDGGSARPEIWGMEMDDMVGKCGWTKEINRGDPQEQQTREGTGCELLAQGGVARAWAVVHNRDQ